MEVPSFLNKNGSRDFLDKQKNLFDVLDSVEKETKRTEPKQYFRKESQFKEPIDLPLRVKKRHRTPDFQRNPHKWTKYSLADITQDDMSNASNTAAALSFLKEMKIQKKQQKMVKMEVTEGERKVTPSSTHQFSLSQRDEQSSMDSEKPVFKCSKLIMPEYIVGQAKKVTKVPKKKVCSEKGKEIYLNHIHEYDDE